jgi:hypothetical protein
MEQNINQPNPLMAFMRQPKIYIRLPSNGQYWKKDALIISETGEYPVYSMTAKDELMLKIPDALMNGQAVVDVIQNCMPNIKNAWEIPNLDIDAILIAIRLATYGEKMSMPVKFGDTLELEYDLDLHKLLDSVMTQVTWDPIVPINSEMTIFVKPLTYKSSNESALGTFETQKILQIVNSDGIDEQQKLSMFQDSFKKLTGITLGFVTNSIYQIDTSSGSTTDVKFIEEYIANCDKEVFNKVFQHLEKLREQNSVKPLVVDVTDEMKEAGITGETIEIPVTFDAASFFD